MVNKKKKAIVQSLKDELERILSSLNVTPDPFTLQHFSIVSNHKTDLEKCLDLIFPPLSIRVDPSYYDLSGPKFETRTGFSDNVLFTRTSCDSFSDELELSQKDIIFFPEQNTKTSAFKKTKEEGGRYEQGTAQPNPKIASLYSPGYETSGISIQTLDKLVKPPSASTTPTKTAWKKKDKLMERLGNKEVSKTHSSAKESKDGKDTGSLTADRRRAKVEKSSPTSKKLGKTTSAKNVIQKDSLGRIPNLFSVDTLAKLTEEPTLEAAEYSASPGRILNPVKVPSTDRESVSTSRRTIGLNKTCKRSMGKLGSCAALKSTLNPGTEERKSSPTGMLFISKSQSPKNAVSQYDSGRIDLYCNPSDEKISFSIASRNHVAKIKARAKASSQSKSMVYHFDKKLKDDKSFAPLFNK